MILAIDTSTALTSVAVIDDGVVVAEMRHLDARRHAEVLAPMLRDLLAETGIGADQIDVIACGVGPGPYTGLRVGIATARAVGAAWRRPVYGVCSLDAIAAAALDAGLPFPVGVATDARRHEVYWAAYSPDGTRPIGPLVSRPDAIAAELRAGTWVGQGVLAHEGAFGADVTGDDESSALLYPHACWIGRRAHELVRAGGSVEPDRVPLVAHGEDGSATSAALLGQGLLAPVPLYLRRPDAVEVADRRA